MKKAKFEPTLAPLSPQFWTPFAPNFGRVQVSLDPLKILDVMPPYLKTLFEQ